MQGGLGGGWYVSLKTIWDLPALIRGEGTAGSEFRNPLAPAAPPCPARCPVPGARCSVSRCSLPMSRCPCPGVPVLCTRVPVSQCRGRAALPTPSPAPSAPRAPGNGDGGRRAGLGAEAVSCSGRNLRVSAGCKCPGREREGGQEGSSHPCGSRGSRGRRDHRTPAAAAGARRLRSC